MDERDEIVTEATLDRYYMDPMIAKLESAPQYNYGDMFPKQEMSKEEEEEEEFQYRINMEKKARSHSAKEFKFYVTKTIPESKKQSPESSIPQENQTVDLETMVQTAEDVDRQLGRLKDIRCDFKPTSLQRDIMDAIDAEKKFIVVRAPSWPHFALDP